MTVFSSRPAIRILSKSSFWPQLKARLLRFESQFHCLLVSWSRFCASVSLSRKWGWCYCLPHRVVVRVKWGSICKAVKLCLACNKHSTSLDVIIVTVVSTISLYDSESHLLWITYLSPWAHSHLLFLWNHEKFCNLTNQSAFTSSVNCVIWVNFPTNTGCMSQRLCVLHDLHSLIHLIYWVSTWHCLPSLIWLYHILSVGRSVSIISILRWKPPSDQGTIQEDLASSIFCARNVYKPKFMVVISRYDAWNECSHFCDRERSFNQSRGQCAKGSSTVERWKKPGPLMILLSH